MTARPPAETPIVAVMFHSITIVAYAIHVASGSIGLVAGTLAGLARKGGNLHRKAGTVFVWSMFLMALFASYLALVVPDQIVNLFISTLVIYLVASAWMAIRPVGPATAVGDKITLGVALALWAPFAILSFQLASGMSPLFTSAVPFKGAVLIAIYAFTAILTVAVIGDSRLVLTGRIAGAPRLTRHLWRMCLRSPSAFNSMQRPRG